MEDPSFSPPATYFLLGFQPTVLRSNDLKSDFFPFIEFIAVTLVNKITQVSKDWNILAGRTAVRNSVSEGVKGDCVDVWGVFVCM